MTILPCKRFVMIKTIVIRFSHYVYLIDFRRFYNSPTGMTRGPGEKASKDIQSKEKV